MHFTISGNYEIDLKHVAKRNTKYSNCACTTKIASIQDMYWGGCNIAQTTIAHDDRLCLVHVFCI